MAFSKSFIRANIRQALNKSRSAFDLQQKALLLQSEANAITALFTPEEIAIAEKELSEAEQK